MLKILAFECNVIVGTTDQHNIKDAINYAPASRATPMRGLESTCDL